MTLAEQGIGGQWFVDHWFAVLLFGIYALVLAFHARVGLRRSRSAEDFFVGVRRMGGVVLGVSFYATFASTNSYIGNAGKGYEYGVPWLTMAVFFVIFTYVSWRVVAPRLRRFTADWQLVTVPDFLAVRFASRRVRMASAVIVAFASLLFLVAIFKGAGNLFQVFLNIRYEFAVAITLAIVVLYTSVGGFISVVRTDVVQGALMLVGSLMLFYFVTSAAGGIGVIMELPAREDTAHLVELNAAIPFVVLLGIALSGSLKLLIDPRQISRFYGLKDERSIKVGMWVALIGILIVQFSLFPIGLYARFLLDGVTDTDLVVPLLVNDPNVVPNLFGDFLIIAILAAAMSSLDSVLLVAASVVSRDLIGQIVKTSQQSEIRFTRIGVIGFALVGALIALRPPGGIVEITIFSGSLYAVCFIPGIVLGLHWRRGNETAALAAFGLGIAVLVGWRVQGFNAVLHEVFPALIASIAVYALVARFSPSVDDPRVVRFFEGR